MVATGQTRNFGIDPRTGRLRLGSWHIPLPRSRLGRICLGSALMFGGMLGFLPVLGFWMVPLGFIVLSNDIPFVRRRRRRLAVWWERRKRRRDAAATVTPRAAQGSDGSDKKSMAPAEPRV